MTPNLNDNFYNRPNQDWSCPIHNAPIVVSDGNDPESIHCSVQNLDQVPAEKPNLENQHASKIDYAAIACKPEPSIRSRRKKFTLLCTALTIGFLVISFSIPQRNILIAPGPLTSNHAQLLAEQGNDRCASCHDAGNGSPLAWLVDAFSAGNHHRQPQSELCLKCHEQMMADTQPMLAHNVTFDQINQIRVKQNNRPGFQLASFKKPFADDQKIACAVCHREHHGANHDLTAMTDKQCQSCHREQFASFESGHPEFNRYPHKRRTRIAFDHSTHFGKHFPDKNKAFDCAQCHIGDSFQDVQRLKPFEQSCAKCHDQSISTFTAEGMQLVNLPIVDTDSLDLVQNVYSFGEWPKSCTGDFDGEIPELLGLLLQSNEKTAPDLIKLGSHFSFDSSELAKSVQVWRYCWALKKLLYEISNEGNAAIERRLRIVFRNMKDDSTVSAFANAVDVEALNRATRNWFPKLKHDMTYFEKIEEFKNVEYFSLSTKIPKEVIDGYGKIIRRLEENEKKESELLSKNPLSEIIEKPDKKPKVKNVLSPGDTNTQGTIRNPYQEPDKIGNDGELLAENPLVGLINPNKQLLIPTQSETNPAKPPATPTNEKLNVQDMLHAIRDANRKRRGIWLADDETYSVRYQPTGHADEFLKALTELLLCETENEFALSLRKKMLSNKSTGSCTSCHTVEKNSDGKLFVNWNAFTRDPSVRTWTRFSHRPHLIQPQTADCTSCHKIDMQNPITENFVGVDPYQGKSNFVPLTVNDCMSCHQKGQASNRCTTCHSYHIGSKVISRIK